MQAQGSGLRVQGSWFRVTHGSRVLTLGGLAVQSVQLVRTVCLRRPACYCLLLPAGRMTRPKWSPPRALLRSRWSGRRRGSRARVGWGPQEELEREAVAAARGAGAGAVARGMAGRSQKNRASDGN